MWTFGWRDRVWETLSKPWDILIIGGGITGAGLFSAAVQAGWRALLVEKNDFASGTSSRSSKLVHGGFRYLKNGQVRTTLTSIHERDRLLKDARGLVNPLGFLMPAYQSDRLPSWVLKMGLTLYDLLAWQWSHRFYDALDILELCPLLSETGLNGGYRFFDAQTDDARLVLRIIRTAVAGGGTALNYTQVSQLLMNRHERVVGVALTDRTPGQPGRTCELTAGVVVNATGAWADELRPVGLTRQRHLRPLRGSHLVFPHARLPLTRAVSIWHPLDHRPVFAIPWEGVTILGTTDVDHSQSLDQEPGIHASEMEYLLQAAQFAFPCQELSSADIQATFSGIRAVVDTGKSDPSKESREHIIWYENGLLTVTGGKLTTYRHMARAALRRVAQDLPAPAGFEPGTGLRVSTSPETPAFPLKGHLRQRIAGRLGSETSQFFMEADPLELTPIASSHYLWSELRWAAAQEGVVHLSDLLLRRVRLSLVLPHGGIPLLSKIRSIVQNELSWDDARWQAEVTTYNDLWNRCYYLPHPSTP